MANAPQQAAPQQKTPFGNKIAVAIMLGLALIVCILEWTHNGSAHQQEAATSHHSVHSTSGAGG